MEPLDLPALVLALVVHAFAGDRAEWGQAMLGELAHVEGRRERWRFVRGCARATLLARRPAQLTLMAVGAGVSASAGPVGFAFWRHPDLRLGISTTLYVEIFASALIGYSVLAVAAVRRLAAAGRQLLATALLGGAVIAGLCGLIGIAPEVGLTQRVGEVLLVVVVLAGAMVGAIGSRRAGRAATGRAAASLAAVVAGLSVFLVWVTGLLVASAPADEVDSLRVYAAAYVPPVEPTTQLSDQLGGAIGLLVLIPLLAMALGCLGAAVGSRRRVRSTR